MLTDWFTLTLSLAIPAKANAVPPPGGREVPFYACSGSAPTAHPTLVAMAAVPGPAVPELSADHRRPAQGTRAGRGLLHVLQAAGRSEQRGRNQYPHRYHPGHLQ